MDAHSDGRMTKDVSTNYTYTQVRILFIDLKTGLKSMLFDHDFC